MNIACRLFTIITIIISIANVYSIDMITDNQKQELEWGRVVNQVAQYGVLPDNHHMMHKILDPRPTMNIQSTIDMQQDIQYLVNNDNTREHLVQQLNSAKDTLSTIEHFIADIDALQHMKADITGIKNACSNLTGSSHSMSIYGLMLDQIAPRWMPKSIIYTIPFMFGTGINAYFAYVNLQQGIDAPFSGNSYVTSAWNTVASIGGLFTTTSQIKGNISYLYTAHNICQNVSSLIATARNIQKNIHGFQDILGMSNNYRVSNDNLPNYITNTDGIDSLWKVYAWPRILASYNQMAYQIEHVRHLVTYYRKLDALIACANMITKNKDHFTAVNFLKESKTPHVNFNDFWTPEMLGSNPVTNTVRTDDHRRNMLISGPNGTGQTTVMKAIAHSIMLAQSIGFAPATYAHMTPFSHIETYLHLTEDGLSEGLSRFQAEGQRISSIGQHVSRCRGFTLCIMDEPLQGTTPETAGDLVYELGKELCNQPHVTTIIASHLEKPSRLEEEGYPIHNYHIETQEDFKQGNFNITRKLTPGLGWWFSEPVKRTRFLQTFMPHTENQNSLFQRIIQAAQTPQRRRSFGSLYDMQREHYSSS